MINHHEIITGQVTSQIFQTQEQLASISKLLNPLRNLETTDAAKQLDLNVGAFVLEKLGTGNIFATEDMPDDLRKSADKWLQERLQSKVLEEMHVARYRAAAFTLTGLLKGSVITAHTTHSIGFTRLGEHVEFDAERPKQIEAPFLELGNGIFSNGEIRVGEPEDFYHVPLLDKSVTVEILKPSR